jgi:hypothetical protein
MRDTKSVINVRALVALVALLMLSAALGGAWISGKLRDDAPRILAPVPPPDTTPERIIPEQSLSLNDLKGAPIGTMDVQDIGTTFWLQLTASVLAYDTGRTVFHLWKQKGGELLIAVQGQDVICMDCPGVDGVARLSPLFPPPAPAATGLMQIIHDWISPPPPPKLIAKKPDDVVPTSDLRLVSKRGVRFATLGLTSAGDPAMALTDRSGRVQLVWVQHAEIRLDDWQELAAFDSGGALRVSLELRPGKAADLVLYDYDGLPHSFDTQSGKLVQSTEGANEWLHPLIYVPVRPVVLTDIRHQQVWKAP